MTGLPARLPAPPSWLHRPRPTARLRLTLLYGGMFTLAGAALLGLTFWLFDRATAGQQLLWIPEHWPGLSPKICRSERPRCDGAVRPRG